MTGQAPHALPAWDMPGACTIHALLYCMPPPLQSAVALSRASEPLAPPDSALACTLLSSSRPRVLQSGATDQATSSTHALDAQVLTETCAAC